MRAIQAKHRYYTVFAIALLVIVMNVSLCFSTSVWCDEAATINLIKLDLASLLGKVKMDFHPPLYYLGLKLWVFFFGSSLAVMKLFSLLPMVVSILITDLWLLKKNDVRGCYSAVVFTILLGTAPCSIAKNIEVRMYSWALMWVLISMLLSWETRQQPQNRSNWVLLSCSSILAMYTHYFCIICETMVWACLYADLIAMQEKQAFRKLLWVFIPILGYIFWIPVLVRQIRENLDVWTIHLHVGLSYIFELRKYPFEGDYSAVFTPNYTLVFWIILLCLVLLSIVNLYHRKTELKNSIVSLSCICMVCFFGVIALGWLCSSTIYPVLMARYLYTAIGLLWLSMAIMSGFNGLSVREKTFILLLITIMGFSSYRRSIDHEYNTGTNETLAYMDTHMSPDDVIVNDLEVCMCWELGYFFPNNTNYYLEDAVIYENDTMTAWYTQLNHDLHDTKGDIWLFTRKDALPDLALFKDQGFDGRLVYCGDFDNYYYFDLYRIL